jgi:hypothetical protein
MRTDIVYLDAPDRTQDLLNLKWALRAAGYTIASTWHESGVNGTGASLRNHWSTEEIQRLQRCGLLVVVSERANAPRPELAMMAGFALARGIKVCWIGLPVQGLSEFRAVQQYNTAEEFRRAIVSPSSSACIAVNERLAA